MCFFKKKKVKQIEQIPIKKEEPKKKEIIYTKKSLLTYKEKTFYNLLSKLQNDYIVLPQINLATVIEKKSDTKYQNELYRNIDFGIFDKKDFTIKALIELNDESHNTKDRIARDYKVKEICEKANIPLLKFWTNKPNEENYVLNRILTTIKENSIA